MTKPTRMEAGNITPTEEYSIHLLLLPFGVESVKAYTMLGTSQRRSVIFILLVIF